MDRCEEASRRGRRIKPSNTCMNLEWTCHVMDMSGDWISGKTALIQRKKLALKCFKVWGFPVWLSPWPFQTKTDKLCFLMEEPTMHHPAGLAPKGDEKPKANALSRGSPTNHLDLEVEQRYGLDGQFANSESRLLIWFQVMSEGLTLQVTAMYWTEANFECIAAYPSLPRAAPANLHCRCNASLPPAYCLSHTGQRVIVKIPEGYV